jgi:Mn2+/Fe2+ NRAMP family transporter
VQLLLSMQILNGVITPVILVFILVLANRRSGLGDAVNGRVFNAVAAVCVFVVGLRAAAVVLIGVAGGRGLA